MKKRILIFTAFVGVLSLGVSSYNDGPATHGYDCTGAEGAGTGSFVNSTGCMYSGSGCHATTANTGITVAIELDSAGVPTTHYKAGMTYTVKITSDGTATANSHYGFQLNALKDSVSRSSNANAGTWASTGLPAGTQITAPGTYTQLSCIEQTATLAGNTFTKSFTWTAPAAGTGTISFWGVANFVDNDGHENSADVWNTGHVIIHEWPAATAVGVAPAAMTLSAYPNPVSNELNLNLGNIVPGKYSVSVFDMNGRSVMSTEVNATIANAATVINTTNWIIGTYHVVVTNANEKHQLQIVKI